MQTSNRAGETVYLTPEEFPHRFDIPKEFSGPEGQRGSTITDMLTSIALIGGGAALMAAADPENWKSAAAKGGAIGLGLRMMPWAAFAKGSDYAMGMMSTRLLNVRPEIHRRVMKLTQNEMARASAMKAVSEPFLVEADKLPKVMLEELDRATVSNDPVAIQATIAATKSPKLAQSWQVVRVMLDQTGQILQASGRIAKLLPDYFPRVVKDLDKLLEHIGKVAGIQAKGALEKALLDAEKKVGRPLTQEESSKITNDYLLAPFRQGGQPSWAKGRTLAQVTKDLAPFYLNMTDSLHAYIRSTAHDIEVAKFFGKDLQHTQKGGQQHINVDNSIGALVDSLKLNRAEATEVRAVLQARLGPGERARKPAVQGVANVIYSAYLANPLSGAMNFGDIFPTAALHGILPTMQSVSQVLTGRATIRPKDVGLLNHIVDELVSTGGTAKFLNFNMKWGGFAPPDYFGKMVNLNAAKIKFEDWAQTAEGQKKIIDKYGPAFGADLPQLLRDLKARQLTPLTREFYFTELSRMQPISKFENSQLHAENAVSLGVVDVRSMFMMRGFMLKQADLLRREGYNEIRAGFEAKDYARVSKGFGNLVKFSFTLGLSGATPIMITNFLLGKPFDTDWKDIPLNALKTFGWSQYTMDQARKEPWKAVASLAAPPFQLFDDLWQRGENVLKYLPPVGKVLFQQEWTEEGKQRGEEKRGRDALRKIDRELLPWIGDPDMETKREVRDRKREIHNTPEYREMARERRLRREERESQ